MRTTRIGRTTLAYESTGSGEPVLLVHGALIADAFAPMLRAPALAGHRLIVVHRRGYGGSGPADGPLGIGDHAADCRRLLRRMRLPRAHVVGHSMGASIALQLALDAPDLVASLTLLEAATSIGESGRLYREGLARAIARYREGGAEAAVDEFLSARWPAWRDQLPEVVPGGVEQAIAAAPACFEVDLPAVLDWRFGADEAARVTAPVLVVLGGESIVLHPRFGESHRMLLDWLPDAEGAVLPGTAHFPQGEDPEGLAELIAGFLARHPLES